MSHLESNVNVTGLYGSVFTPVSGYLLFINMELGKVKTSKLAQWLELPHVSFRGASPVVMVTAVVATAWDVVVEIYGWRKENQLHAW